MTVHLDTSVLIEALTHDGRALLREPIGRDDSLVVSTLVIYEWFRRPRTDVQREMFDEFFPADRIVAFGADEAVRAAHIYRDVKRARTREIDIAIAACALEHNAALWTLNAGDFRDIPDLRLYST